MTFLMEAIDKATRFFKYGILPELIGKWYTCLPQISEPSSSQTTTSASPSKETDSLETWCYCKTEESGTMIFCDNEICPIRWFHVEFLRITNIPKKKWFCPECRKEKKISRKKNHINGTTASQKLHNAQQITTILSIILVSVPSSRIIMLMGSVDSNIVAIFLSQNTNYPLNMYRYVSNCL